MPRILFLFTLLSVATLASAGPAETLPDWSSLPAPIPEGTRWCTREFGLGSITTVLN
jgi:hypothetical protein